jgi:methionyl-tRNA synthetase
MKYFYITTTLPYVNAEPHIGFGLEIVKADVIARWHRELGDEVFFNTGVDEHGTKIYTKAKELGLEPQVYCDTMAAKFGLLKEALNLSYNNFIRTTDKMHIEAAQEFWRRSLANGDIYKKAYKIKYCVGCELEKTESELVNGHCPLHPNQELELIDEENYFFKFSKYQEPLLKFYEEQQDFVLPGRRFNEIKSFTKHGLEDFSISRLKTKMPWGVAVPDDNEQVMYVWFDALINYISCLGWPDGDNFKKFWPGVQICGKDNLRQQSAMWQAMLMSVGVANSTQVLVNGFIGVDGVKMSKSLGNVVDPLVLVKEYGTDAVRYYLLAEMNPFEDSDFSADKFRARYMGDLANGLGNLASRVSTLLAKNNISIELDNETDQKLNEDFTLKMNKFLFNEALNVLWEVLREADAKLSNEQPWKMTESADIAKSLIPIVKTLRQVAKLLTPLLPQTAEKLQAQFNQVNIVKGESLFPRLD